jgi:hypothetical protein
MSTNYNIYYIFGIYDLDNTQFVDFQLRLKNNNIYLYRSNSNNIGKTNDLKLPGIFLWNEFNTNTNNVNLSIDSIKDYHNYFKGLIVKFNYYKIIFLNPYNFNFDEKFNILNEMKMHNILNIILPEYYYYYYIWYKEYTINFNNNIIYLW